MPREVSKSKVAVGQIALHAEVCPQLPEPPVKSYVYNGARRTIIGQASPEEFYPPQYRTDGSLVENLRFAFKYEPFDLRIITSTLKVLGAHLQRELRSVRCKHQERREFRGWGCG